MTHVAERSVGSGRIIVVQGDLTAQPVSAIVNAANEQLAHGGGVAAAIVRAGGQVIQDESDSWVRDHGPVSSGQAAVTSAGSLPAEHVIHVVGPRYREGRDNVRLLTEAVLAALDTALGLHAESVAMPAVSAGIFGYPREEATSVVVNCAVQWLQAADPPGMEIRLVAYDAGMADAFASALVGAEPEA